MSSILIVLSLALLSTYVVSLDLEAIRNIFGELPLSENNLKELMDSFSLTLTKHVASSSRHNFLISPIALELTLCSLARAAANSTRSQLTAVLGSGLNVSTWNRFTDFTGALKKDFARNPKRFVCQIFIPDQGQEPFVEEEDVYNTELRTINSRDPFKAVKEINSKISTITQGKISNSFDEYDILGMHMLVLNSYYFKSPWKLPFLSDSTGNYTYDFFITPKRTKPVLFMQIIENFNYAESNVFDAKILEVPYETEHVLYFIVPNSLTGLPRVVNNLDHLENELKTLKSHLVDIKLPIFRLDYTSRLTGILKELGVQEAFRDTASFPGIGQNRRLHKGLKISSIMQRLHFEINEYGSDVNSHAVRPVFRLNGKVEVFGNRPFLFLLHDKLIPQPHLIGGIFDPTVAESSFEIV